MPARRHTRVLLVALALGASVGACLLFGHGVAGAAAHFGPALALLAILWTGRYPGERLFAAMRRPRPPRARLARAPVAGRGRLSLAPRGTALLAHHLAVRPPPATSGA